MPNQIIHTIKTKDSKFKYHFLSGLFLAGSTISSKVHPIMEVNYLKKILISSRKIKLSKDGLILKENIKVGLLMAYNLHSDSKVTQIENLTSNITLFKSYPELIDIFKGEIMSIDNEFFQKLHRKCIRLESVSEFRLNFGFLRGAEPNSFSQSEMFVAKLLNKHGFISNNYRHGDTNLSESDIVDDELEKQIEVTFAFKTELSNRKKGPYFDVERILTEFSNNRFIRPSKSLIGKMNKKYTSKYKSFLAILMIGKPESSYTLFLKLLDNLQSEGKFISPFYGYYLITYDPLDNYICISSTIDQKVITDDDCKDFTFVEKTITDYTKLNNKDKYLFVLKDIFTCESPILIIDKNQFDLYAKNLEIHF